MEGESREGQQRQQRRRRWSVCSARNRARATDSLVESRAAVRCSDVLVSSRADARLPCGLDSDIERQRRQTVKRERDARQSQHDKQRQSDQRALTDHPREAIWSAWSGRASESERGRWEHKHTATRSTSERASQPAICKCLIVCASPVTSARAPQSLPNSAAHASTTRYPARWSMETRRATEQWQARRR